MTPADGSGSSDLAHGVVEGEAKDLDMEVDGIAGQIPLGPAPVTVFDDEAGIGGQFRRRRREESHFKPELLNGMATKGRMEHKDRLQKTD